MIRDGCQPMGIEQAESGYHSTEHSIEGVGGLIDEGFGVVLVGMKVLERNIAIVVDTLES
jgi:hypothetical protein